MSESEAVEPEQHRRGPVRVQHPLELPIDPETGDPVPFKPGGGKKRERLPGKDRFGQTPVGKGWYRGRLDNLSRTSVTTPIGDLVTYYFDLVGEEDQPPLQVEFQGYTFSKDIRHGLVLEAYIGKKFPTGRIKRDRFKLTYDQQNDLRAYMPVERYLGKVGKDWKITSFVIAAPFAFACAMIWLLVWALRHYHILSGF